MINMFLFIGMFVGALWRIFDGKIISITIGLAGGILLVDMLKLILWRLK